MTMWDWGTGLHWWGWVLGIAATFIFWALVVWSIVALASRARGPRRGGRSRRRGPRRPRAGSSTGQASSRPRAGSGHGEDTAQALIRRYAAGDIDGAEYDRQLAALYARPYAGAGRN